MSLCRSSIIIRTVVGVIKMTFALRGCHIACDLSTNLKKRTATRLLCHRVVIIPIAAVLSGAVVKCKVTLIGGGADGAARSHYDCVIVVLGLLSWILYVTTRLNPSMKIH